MSEEKEPLREEKSSGPSSRSEASMPKKRRFFSSLIMQPPMDEESGASKLQHRWRQREQHLFFSMLFFGSLTMVLKVVAIIIYATLNISQKASWFGITGTDVAIVVCTILLCLSRRRKHVRILDEVKIGSTDFLSKGEVVSFWRAVWLLWVSLTNLFGAVSTVVLVVDTSDILLTQNHDFSPPVVAMICICAVDAAMNCAFLITVSMYVYLSFAMLSQTFLIMTSFFEVFVSVICIFMTSFKTLTRNRDGDIDETGTRVLTFGSSATIPYFALFFSVVGAAGLQFSLVVSAPTRLSEQNQYAATIVAGAKFFSFLVSCAYLGISIHTAVRNGRNMGLRDILVADPILAFSNMVLTAVGITCIFILIGRPRSKFSIDKYDLNALTDKELKAWASMIDRYSTSTSGDAAISLMRAYEEATIDGMRCDVLRIYDQNVYEQELEHSRDPSSMKDELPPAERPYENVRAWDLLDHPHGFEDDSSAEVKHIVPMSAELQEHFAGGPSKGAIKRAQKKAQKKGKKGAKRNSVSEAFTPETQLSPEQIERELKFRATLMATEALVLLTRIEKYDLTSNLDTSKWYNRIAQAWFGTDSRLQLLCVRMGLLASHWPFREAIFYTAPARKPNARNAALLRSIGYWNFDLDKSERCSVLLSPLPLWHGIESIFAPIGWMTVPMPSTHIVDLRKYKGQSLDTYLHEIRYRNQANAFNKDNGRVVEKHEFDEESCASEMTLWRNIASKRTASGNTSVLVEPTVPFIQSLGRLNDGFRTLLFLEVDGAPIASCVLFRLGNTITSDLQGLDHERGRQYKAYFVMMQETIAIALRENIDFVDFGPTTSKPKVDIGGRQVALVGGMKAVFPLSMLIAAFAGAVHVDE